MGLPLFYNKSIKATEQPKSEVRTKRLALAQLGRAQNEPVGAKANLLTLNPLVCAKCTASGFFNGITFCRKT